MANQKILLEPDKYYHIYNRGINSCNLFKEKTNYQYFLLLYDRHISPVADTFAWVLMRNHFHLLVRVKSEEEMFSQDDSEYLQGLKGKYYQPFSNLFNAYTKAFNKKYNRHGSLFESNFRRKLINSDKYFKSLVIYIHNNPVHHGFCENIIDYPWSSYFTCISFKETKLKRKTVMGWFNNLGEFKELHQRDTEFKKIDRWLDL